MRLGVYVGSFDPIHDGHIKLVNYLLDNNYVDKIFMIPTNSYWDKQVSSIDDRINMLKFFETKNIIIDTIHNNFPYTYQILESIKKEYPKESIYLIIGSDNIINFHKWERVDLLLKYQIIVVNRNDLEVNSFIEKLGKEHFIVVDKFPFLPISSTSIRSGCEKYIDPRVLNYIKTNHLYEKK